MKRIVIYHKGCVDGFASAWVAHLVFGDSAEYVAASYGDAPPDVTGAHVAIVDFSYPRAVLLDMKEKALGLVVIDHHKTAQAALDGLDFCVFDMDRSGAGMAWDYFLRPGQRPWIVDYVQDRDLWRFALPKSKEINGFIRTLPFDFDVWTKASELSRDDAAIRGAGALAYLEQYVREARHHTRRVTFLGHEGVPMINAVHVGISELVGALAEESPAGFAVGWFEKADGQINYSLRSRGDFDVSALAKSMGGGGHAKAAGFVSDCTPWELVDAGLPPQVGAGTFDEVKS